MKCDLIKIHTSAWALLLLMLVLGCNDEKSLELSLDDEILKGPIQSVWIYTYDGKDSLREVIKKELLGAEYIELSNDRRLLSIEGYDYAGKLHQRREMRFSEGLNLVSDVAKNPSGQMIHNYQYRDGLMTKEVFVKENGQTNTKFYEYDAQNKLVYKKHGWDGRFSEVKYIYENGRLIKELDLDKEEELLTTSYVYDGQTRQRRFHRPTGEIYRVLTSKYDQAGNEIELDVAGENEAFTWNERRTFSKNTQLLRKVREDNEGKVEEVYTFDDAGNCVYMGYYNDDELSETRSNVFNYDHMGNWIKKISRYNGNLVDIQERVIVYY